MFFWDHVRWREPVVEVADPWITLAAVATSTERVRPGPMVTAFLPRPVQRPGVPLWVAGFYGKPGPLRRDAGRAAVKPYDVVAALPPSSDPAPHAAAGATWWLVEFPWEAVSVDQVRGVIRDGPAASP